MRSPRTTRYVCVYIHIYMLAYIYMVGICIYVYRRHHIICRAPKAKDLRGAGTRIPQQHPVSKSPQQDARAHPKLRSTLGSMIYTIGVLESRIRGSTCCIPSWGSEQAGSPGSTFAVAMLILAGSDESVRRHSLHCRPSHGEHS